MMLAIGEQFGFKGMGVEQTCILRAQKLWWYTSLSAEDGNNASYSAHVNYMGTGNRPSLGVSRLGLHIDSTGLVSQGIMSKPMKEMRDALFWDVFVLDRLFSIIMGVHPLQNRRFISTRRPTGGMRSGLLPGGITLVGGEPDGTLTHDTLAPVEVTSIWIRDLCDAVETMLLEL
ncbi:nitrogen assimilation transcription factor nirA [Ceratobasidium sp. AG-Ba]|nr:nitrogen assimilation transcription factor nirA [Ceratobasidium sp. AG-Ba]